ncbi:unnamed protein product [Onchocerca flexuosa]|uniref:UTP--glucose-1-phosphate uridylyltransferase n=1 Tax=Onchocerca flexuosa TaxID=387005 RepID=A0A183H895_9BILA|nr:unnamed protein product [Onchocerca flexuosa]
MMQKGADKSSEEWKSSTKRETLLGMEQELRNLLETALPDQKESTKKELSGFRDLFSRFLRAKTTIEWKKIQPLPDNAIISYKELKLHDPSKDLVTDRLSKLVVVKLNGGLGTSMGCKGPKSAISVRNDLTFLDLTLQQIQNMNRTYDVNVPLVLMNSFNTDEDTKKLLRKYKNVQVDVHSFCQSKYPRIFKESLMPIVKNVADSDHDE